MKNLNSIFTLLFLFIFCSISSINAQNQKYIDSLKLKLKTANDTDKVNIYISLAKEISFYDPNIAEKYSNEALLLSQNINYKVGMSMSYNALGIINMNKANYNKALKYYQNSLTIDIECKNYNNIATSYSNIGNINYFQGKYDYAIEEYFKSLKIDEKIGDKTRIGNTLVCIGAVFWAKKQYEKALEYLHQSIPYYEKADDKSGLSNAYVNIGGVLYEIGNYEKALQYGFKALSIFEELGDKNGIAGMLNNIGESYQDFKKYDKALEYKIKALKIQKEISDSLGIAISLRSIGNIYYDLNKNKEAIQNLLESIKISESIGAKQELIVEYRIISDVYSDENILDKALVFHRKYSDMKDSVINQESNTKITEIQTKYETEKKDQEIKVKNLLIDKKVSENKKQQILIFAFIIGFILVLLFSLLLYRLFIQKKKANILLAKRNAEVLLQKEEISTQRDEIEAQRDEIEAQRDLVTLQKENIEEIHKEVTDSINYAKRIQEALLPVTESARSILGEHFILFKPKNIVSGDFYWTTKINNVLFIAVADCTGHGVPGAFMSMLGISFLNEIVQKQEIKKANQILNQLRIEVVNALQQKGVHGEQKDGMDISLLVVNIETNEAQWAGANNPLYIVRKLKVESDKVENQLSENNELSNFINFQLDELKGDKMPIAIYPKMNDFTNHEFILSKGDSVYLFTDGFADQFGGNNGRKFMYKQFKEILINNMHKSMPEQKEILNVTFEGWKGVYEQIDDVTILGIRI